jgi:hypothetical protein
MSGGNTVVGLWRNKGETPERIVDPTEALIVETAQTPEENWGDEDEEAAKGGWRRPLALSACLLAGTSWIAALGYERYTLLAGSGVGLSDILSFASTASAPLALISVGWLLIQRSSQREQSRFARTAESLQKEGRRLEALLSFVSKRLDDSRVALSEQSDSLMRIGEDAASRLNIVTQAMQVETETISRHGQALKGSAAAARGDMAVLLANLPKAQVQTRQMVAALQEAGLTAHEKAGALDAQLSLLTERGREADLIAGNAAQKLAAHLSRMEGVSEVAGARLEQAAGQMTGAVDAALERASEALESARMGMEAQGSAMIAMIEQNQATMARTGSDAAEAMGTRVTQIAGQIDQVAQTFAAQDRASQALVSRLDNDLGAIETRFAAFDAEGTARTERLGTAITALRDHADDLRSALAGGGDTANALVGKVESLMTALDAATREIDETMPAAWARLELKAQSSLDAVAAATPVVSGLADTAAQALDRLSEADAILTRQRAALEKMASMSAEQLSESKATAEALSAAIAAATADAEQLAGSAAPKLLDSLVRVRETANQASEHVRTAFAELIPQSAEALGASARDSLAEALTAQVETQMAAIAQTTENAVAAAQGATDRLMRQMLTIADTSASLEARIAESKDAVERSDQGNFARRVALLIESLNSTAIDVTKILSNDVTDTAWASYLRGDRGIFTRRAVRLLDASEVREVMRHYDNEPEFREQVNRYIHDFEAMLRNVLATRDGSPLSVTLLSSDAGKLYVALAQAIERLRT